jgi:hypothetical protein
MPVRFTIHSCDVSTPAARSWFVTVLPGHITADARDTNAHGRSPVLLGSERRHEAGRAGQRVDVHAEKAGDRVQVFPPERVCTPPGVPPLVGQCGLLCTGAADARRSVRRLLEIRRVLGCFTAGE